MEAPVGVPPLPPSPPTPPPRLRSLVFPPLFGFGAGFTELLFASHVVAVVVSLGGTSLVALAALAAGAATSIVVSPLVAAVSDQRLGGRAPLAVALNIAAAGTAAGVGGLAGMYSPSADGPRYAAGKDPPLAPLIAAVGLAAVYRVVTAASPSVPALIETAMTLGEGAAFPARRDLILSFYYLWYRMGIFAAGITVLHTPGGGSARERVLPYLGGGAALAAATMVITAVSLRRPPRGGTGGGGGGGGGGAPPGAVGVWAKARSDVLAALVASPRPLHWMYLTVGLAGVAYGTLGAVVAPYYASIIFVEAQGSGRSLRWTAMAALSAWAVGLGVDAGVPLLAGRLPSPLARLLWPAFLLIGAGLFVGLALATTAQQAITLLTCQAIVTSGNAFFSLIGAGSLVPPALRATTFGMRGAAAAAGLLVGGLGGGAFAAAWADGYRYTMFLSAGACVMAAAAAVVVGPLPGVARVPGVATSANPLWTHLATRAVRWVRRTRYRRRGGGTAPAAVATVAAVALGNSGEGRGDSGEGHAGGGVAAPLTGPADYWLDDEAAYWRWQEAAKAAREESGAGGDAGGGDRAAAAAALTDILAAVGGEVEALASEADQSPDVGGVAGV
ncbi:hypothetical protein MMPV_007301 [Pyropia vietnamensis]